jgi:AraC-like DNA-binding protein
MSRVANYFHRYLPVSEPTRNWGLYVTGAGFGLTSRGSPYPRKGHPITHQFAWEKGRILHEYAIVHIKTGQGRFQCAEGDETPIEAGTTILLFPDVWHRYRPLESTGWEEYWVCFDGEYARNLQARGFIGPGQPLLRTGSDELITRAFSELLDRMRSEPIGFEQLIAASAWEIIAAVLSAARWRGTSSRQHELVRRAKLILEDQSKGPPVMEEIAAELGLSLSHLQHVFKELSGLSPYQYHLQLKVQRARELLRGSDLSVKQIAKILCFDNAYHFSTLFRKKTGQSPTQWRTYSRGGGLPPRKAEPGG